MSFGNSSRSTRKRVNDEDSDDLFGFGDIDPQFKRIKTVEEKKFENKQKLAKSAGESSSSSSSSSLSTNLEKSNDASISKRKNFTNKKIFSQVKYDEPSTSDRWISSNSSRVKTETKNLRDKSTFDNSMGETTMCKMRVVGLDKSALADESKISDTSNSNKKFMKKNIYKTQSTKILKFTKMRVSDLNNCLTTQR